jgi:hypothetical protein
LKVVNSEIEWRRLSDYQPWFFLAYKVFWQTHA